MKILICDDQAIVCEGLSRILSSDPGLTVVGIAFNGADALDLVPKTKPELILMDLKMPIMNGVVATRKIKEKFPEIAILILTTYDDDEWIFDAIRAGANGYLLKDTPPKELMEAIKGTLDGKTYIDPGIGAKIFTQVNVQKRQEKSLSTFSLSDRESEVLSLLAQGLTNADIAQQLFLTEGTVRNYTSDIFKKIGVSDRTQAAIIAIRYGLVDSDSF